MGALGSFWVKGHVIQKKATESICGSTRRVIGKVVATHMAV